LHPTRGANDFRICRNVCRCGVPLVSVAAHVPAATEANRGPAAMIVSLSRVLLVMLSLVLCGAACYAQIDERDALNRRILELQKAGKYEAAIELASDRADTIEARYGEQHPEYAAALRDLAGLYVQARRLPRAERLFRRALAIDEASLGPDHPTVATDLNELGVLLTDANRFADAEPLLRRALEIDERNLGADHRNVAADLFNVGLLLRRADRPADAEPFLRQALAIEEKNYGPTHPRVAVVLTDLALLLRASDRAAEAEQLERRARAINEKKPRPIAASPTPVRKPVFKPPAEPRKPPPPRPAPPPQEPEFQRIR
jgi:tetratricopeptide (TPR) repeat protein